MRILYLWWKDYPWEVRVEKVCRALAAAGHEVHVTARNLGRRALREELDGMVVHRLRHWRGARANYFLSFPFFGSPWWRRLVERTIVRERIELLVIRDLPMAPAGLAAARRHGIPTVLDMAENYVAMLEDMWRFKGITPLNLVVRNPHLARRVERWSVPRFDEILVVTEEAAEVVVRAGGDRARITLVGNTPPLAALDRARVPESVRARIGDRRTVIFTGALTANRGLETVVDALPALAAEVPDVLFAVAGEGYHATPMQARAAARGIADRILWAGWTPHEQLYGWIAAARVGIVPHPSTPHIDTTLPNKLFDYMACGLPVVTSDAAPLRRIVEEAGCGLVFRSGDPASLAAVTARLLTAPDGLGARGREAVRTRWNWEADARRLVTAVERAAERR